TSIFTPMIVAGLGHRRGRPARRTWDAPGRIPDPWPSAGQDRLGTARLLAPYRRFAVAAEGGQQLGLAGPGMDDVALLDRAEAADLFRKRRELDRRRQVVGVEAGEDLLHHPLVVGDQ